MKIRSFFMFASIFLSGCAEERILRGTHSYYQEISRLPVQEVVDNIDSTIDDKYRIPTRTTFGKGNLTFTDNAQATASIPLHILSTNAGTAGGNLGAYTDSYQLAIVPEVDSTALADLAFLYRGLIYREGDGFNLIPNYKVKWIYWSNLDGTVSRNPPPIDEKIYFIGSGQRHAVYVTDPDAYQKFILLTFGYSPDIAQVPASPRPAPAIRDPGRQEAIKPPQHPGERAPAGDKGTAIKQPAPGIPPGRAKPAFKIIPERQLPSDNSPALPTR